ncbi:MAG: hypothetical protein R3A10_04210 [Caldilineaceae bacterium]
MLREITRPSRFIEFPPPTRFSSTARRGSGIPSGAPLERDAWVRYLRLSAAAGHSHRGALLADHRSDLILSVHPMVQHITAQALAWQRQPCALCTVVTDLATAHRAWFHPEATCCFVAGPAAQ